MGRLRDAGIRVFIVAGNHDAASQITKHLRLPDNVTLFSTKKPERVVLDDLNVSICGSGFRNTGRHGRYVARLSAGRSAAL